VLFRALFALGISVNNFMHFLRGQGIFNRQEMKQLEEKLSNSNERKGRSGSLVGMGPHRVKKGLGKHYSEHSTWNFHWCTNPWVSC
jgi:hypothetical protein